MKSKIPIQTKISRKELEELRSYCDGLAQEGFTKNSERAMRRWFKLLAVALNDRFGFGKDRLFRLFGDLTELIRIHDEEDVEFWTHTDRRCEQIGVLNVIEGNLTQKDESDNIEQR